ncbi:MAG: copper-containing nitrite reductase [Terriglobia bacterium]|nr:copper-containing nitrite reductase [Terriglobia bacterium]
MQPNSGSKVRLTISSLGLLFLFFFGSAHVQAQTSSHAMHMGTANSTRTVDIVRAPTDVPPPIGNRGPAVVRVTLTAEEVIGDLDSSSGTKYRYWTFNGKVPAPMIRVRQGDTVEVTLKNDAGSHMVHSVDFHAALGPGGGAAFSQAAPGQSKTFSFKATTPGLFVYHCGTPMIAEHIANGMYGLILVEPAGGLPHVDHEYYLMQGEFYTAGPEGTPGLQQFSAAKLMKEEPDYFVFNGAVDALTKTRSMQANVGDTVRIFFGDAGPNKASSLHMVGEIFTKDYQLGSMSMPLTGVQTASVPPGGAAMLELTATAPGNFALMDHAMSRMAKGLMANLAVTGTDTAKLMSEGPVSAESGESVLSGMTKIDMEAPVEGSARSVSMWAGSADETGTKVTEPTAMSMPMEHTSGRIAAASGSPTIAKRGSPTELDGCMNTVSGGEVMLKLLGSSKIYRLEAQPFLFSENSGRIVHVTGHVGSVVEVEDPNIPSFVVDTLQAVAPNCSVRMSAADVRKIVTKASSATVRMGEMRFEPANLTVEAGEKVTWKNSSNVTHNVVDDASKAVYLRDVNLPSGTKPFDSGYLVPDQTYSRVFTTPGIYRYVCTLHEASGMKGTIIVRPRTTEVASSNSGSKADQ